MPSSAIAAYGTLLKIGDGGGTEVFTTIAEVKSIDGPSKSVEVIDVTTHSSAADGAYREKIASLIDPGEISFDINLVPTGATHNPTTGLMADMDARTKRNFQLVFPDGGSTTWQFAGYVTNFGITSDTEGVLEASITITITGAIDYTP